MLRIALPNKGGLSQDALTLVQEAGYRCRRQGRELVVLDPENQIEFFFLRPHDIAVYVDSEGLSAARGEAGRFDDLPERLKIRILAACEDEFRRRKEALIRNGMKKRDGDWPATTAGPYHGKYR